MHVVATAGHVDHGKSRLVRALTGMEPDRWAEERRRGMTIDLGFAWTPLGDQTVAFVDVPGHERFIGNMLAGLGPAPTVMFVVAADQGWQPQSDEHLAAVRALGVTRVLLVVTRADLADPAATRRDAQDRMRAAGVPPSATVTASAHTGAGVSDVRAALAQMVSAAPTPDPGARVRLWIDRAFTVRGAGTVVTGTLPAGTVRPGDELELDGDVVHVRGVQVTGDTVASATGPARVALNLRNVPLDRVARGAVLLTPRAWWRTALLDVRLDDAPEDVTGSWTLHAGTASIPVHVRPLVPGAVRLRLPRAVPLAAGDRALLRHPGSRRILGLRVLDADPPPLRRRGAAARWGATVLANPRDVSAEVARRDAVAADHLRRLGYDPEAARAARTVGRWVVSDDAWTAWEERLRAAVSEAARQDPLAPGLPLRAAAHRAGLPDAALVEPLARAAGLTVADGTVRASGTAGLGRAETAVAALEQRLLAEPFVAPEADDLAGAGLGRRELATAARLGRLLVLPGPVVLRADAPDVAVARLAGIGAPFTLSQARQVLGTTRRVAVPLLEHLDGLGRTERIDDRLRRIRD